ncbi:MarR family winged helix-turn-helix transcriptional regulator [Leucobacter ruminantium]|uniref:MarR family transcriptional regulator n=1 Tax=Leucobacter ruminantium TaxID=1289170 RepID=A0A939LU54_9MICO|nr:MarR family transcriptional regulator [Leucobacter ruminantium]MBO1804432.1 MarR family transcriptional regulator [Leucobacter ruminantium]
MADPEAGAPSDPVSDSLYDVDSSDPRSELIDRSGMSAAEVSHIGRLMKALSDLRAAESRLTEASQRYMKLSAKEMRALHYLIVAQNRGGVATPGALAAHLGISPASTTKLLNRLEHGGHIRRGIHPLDRRAIAVEITPETERAAMQSVGRQQANRFHAAARLTADERDTVIGFLEDMTRELSTDGPVWGAPADDR